MISWAELVNVYNKHILTMIDEWTLPSKCYLSLISYASTLYYMQINVSNSSIYYSIVDNKEIRRDYISL